MQSRYPEAVKTVDWADPKVEVQVEVTSTAAATLREGAEKLVDIYFANAELTFEDADPYTVSAVLTKPRLQWRATRRWVSPSGCYS